MTGHGVEDIIYDNPAKEGQYPVQDLEERFDILNRNAKALQRILTPAKGKECVAARTIRKKGEDLLRTLLKVGGRDSLAAQLAYLISAKIASQGISDTNADVISSLVHQYLRQSLRREVRKDGKEIRVQNVIEGMNGIFIPVYIRQLDVADIYPLLSLFPTVTGLQLYHAQ